MLPGDIPKMERVPGVAVVRERQSFVKPKLAGVWESTLPQTKPVI